MSSRKFWAIYFKKDAQLHYKAEAKAKAAKAIADLVK